MFGVNDDPARAAAFLLAILSGRAQDCGGPGGGGQAVAAERPAAGIGGGGRCLVE